MIKKKKNYGKSVVVEKTFLCKCPPVTDTKGQKVRQNAGKTPKMSTSDGQKWCFPLYRGQRHLYRSVFPYIYRNDTFCKVFSPI